MISIDAVLLGLTVIGFIASIPLGMGVVALLLWANARSRSGTGRRKAYGQTA